MPDSMTVSTVVVSYAKFAKSVSTLCTNCSKGGVVDAKNEKNQPFHRKKSQNVIFFRQKLGKSEFLLEKF